VRSIQVIELPVPGVEEQPVLEYGKRARAFDA
jgi:hypothetical protein